MKTQYHSQKSLESVKDMDKELNVCDKCGHELPSPLDRIPIVLKKLKKEMGYGEKCKSKQSKG